MNIQSNSRKIPTYLSRVFSALLIIAFLFALLPLGVSEASAASKCTYTHQVARGNTLDKIASRYGVKVNEIIAVNGWTKPYTIYVGQNICIPTSKVTNPPKIDQKYTTAPAAYFIAGRKTDSILVYTVNYPKTLVLVKVADANAPGRNFYTVGKINIANTGNGKSFTFKLPAQLKNASRLTICLKDRTTSYLQCIVPRSGS